MRHRLTIIKDARTPAWGLQFLKHPSRDLCHILHCTGTGCHLIVRSERRTFCMDFITNTHGKTVPHDGGRGFCGAHVCCLRTLPPAFGLAPSLTTPEYNITCGGQSA